MVLADLTAALKASTEEGAHLTLAKSILEIGGRLTFASPQYRAWLRELSPDATNEEITTGIERAEALLNDVGRILTPPVRVFVAIRAEHSQDTPILNDGYLGLSVELLKEVEGQATSADTKCYSLTQTRADQLIVETITSQAIVFVRFALELLQRLARSFPKTRLCSSALTEIEGLATALMKYCQLQRQGHSPRQNSR